MTRDLTRAQFKRAIEKNGFKLDLMGWGLIDTTGVMPDRTVGAVVSSKGKMRRRTTLARAMQARRNHVIS